MDVIGLIFLLLYVYLGDKANYYLKYHLLGRRAEIYNDTGNYLLSRAIWGTLLGWVTIPVTFLHKVFFNRGD